MDISSFTRKVGGSFMSFEAKRMVWSLAQHLRLLAVAFRRAGVTSLGPMEGSQALPPGQCIGSGGSEGKRNLTGPWQEIVLHDCRLIFLDPPHLHLFWEL